MELPDSHLRLLRDSDLKLLAAVSTAASVRPERLRADPEALNAILTSNRLFDALFRSQARHPLLVGSPFLVFWVLVHRVTRDVEGSSFVEEWLGPRRSLPVFDAASLRDFLAEGGHRVFLAELLASYTHVASGSIFQRTPRGWQRQRYSELDPVRLAQFAEAVAEHQRPQVFRRLGDLALFSPACSPSTWQPILYSPGMSSGYAAFSIPAGRKRCCAPRVRKGPSGSWSGWAAPATARPVPGS